MRSFEITLRAVTEKTLNANEGRHFNKRVQDASVQADSPTLAALAESVGLAAIGPNA